MEENQIYGPKSIKAHPKVIEYYKNVRFAPMIESF